MWGEQRGAISGFFSLHTLLISNDSVALCDIGNSIVYNMTYSYFLSQNQQFGVNYLLYEILKYGNI